MFNLLITSLSFFYFILFTSDLDVSNIPVDLLTDASAVVRYENSVNTIKSLDKVVLDYEKAVTVLNKKGNWAGQVSIPYQKKASKVSSLKIEIYNAKGELIKKVKKRDIQDVSSYDGFSIANDSRLIAYNYTANQYPYTIKYSYQRESKNTLTMGGWYPQRGTAISVESSNYSIINKADVQFLSKAYNIDESSIHLDMDNHSFSAKNVSAIKKEVFAPNFLEYAPFVRLTPKNFEYYGELGEFSDWKSYGKWVYDKMLTGRNNLPEELISIVKDMIPEDASDIEKAKIIYDYVTNSTRYVSVQLGVGGMQPFKCSDVYDLKYGDCKALSFYTVNLLQEVRVQAIYTEIHSDNDYARSYDAVMPGPGQGNHIVLCLPTEKDTTWLECTSNGVLFDYTHSGINDRRALLIKEDGGELVMTGGYSALENKKVVKGKLIISKENIAEITLASQNFNYRYEKMRLLHGETDKKRKKYLKSYYYDNLPSLEIVDYDIKIDSLEIMIEENVHFVSNNLIESAGEYRLIPYNLTNITVPKKLKSKRKQDLYIKEGISDDITIDVIIPDGYKAIIETEDDIDFKNEFGSIQTNLKAIGEAQVQISTSFIRNKGRFPADKVHEYNDFVKALNAFSEHKLVLKPI